jgi:class 3 adenylate cyclase/tetratricopeptide (TPR) repeat protein
MKCPKCQTDNREGAKFCNECGHKFELACPECGIMNRVGSKFCDECGHNLTLPSEEAPKPLSPEEKIEKIQKYLPKGIAEKILAQRDRIEGERKQVTVMFCDMEGFTGLSEKIDPEEVYSIMDQVYEILIHKVHDYEGTVNEMTGDGIMALFGAPIALEDAPQRAIRSAYAIHREMTRFNDKMKQEKEGLPQLKMRIGIHTGPVVVGTLGNDLRVEFKAVGDTVNLASRMEGLAEPGSTFVTKDTFNLTEGFFRCEALGEHAIKGKEETVKAYRVIAPRTIRTRFDVSAERGLTPFVGRRRELELLLDGFERSKAGKGQAFSIVSEAGVGKSRLLYEFRKAVSNEDVTFQEGKCLSYGRGVAYHPIIDIVKPNFDILENDGDSEIREKLKRGLNILEADEASTLPYLLECLSVKDSGVDTISLSPEARKDRIIEALIRIALKASERRPLIWAIEDLHWIDKSSVDVCKSLLDSITGARVFLIFTYRPEFVHTWGVKSYLSQVNLNRLSNRESLMMVCHLLDEAEIQGDLEDFILEKTEGVPFFIEEFIRSLRDLKIIEKKDNTYHLTKNVQALSIPSTIQDVIMARVDSLPEGAKELLQTGSVIEREFKYELIKRIMGISQEELLSHLSVLKESELLYERGIYPQSIYIFQHALTREVVYDSILTRKKKKLHEEIGNAIEQLYKDNLHDHYGILTEHFINGENYEKGAEYCRLTGRKAEKAGSLDDAIDFRHKQIACLERLPQTEYVEKNLIDVRTVLGLYYAQMGRVVRAKEVIDPIVDKAINLNYKRRVSQIYGIIGAYSYMAEEDFLKAFKQLKEALKTSEDINDTASLFFANYLLGVVLSFNCELEGALHYLEKALAINIKANVPWGISAVKTNIVIWVYVNQGKIDLAYETSKEALRIADESGDVFSKAHAYAACGFSYYFKGYFEEAEAFLLKATNLSERINFLMGNIFSHIRLGDTYLEIKEYQKSEEHYDKAICFLEYGKYFFGLENLNKISIAKAKVMKNETDIDLTSLYSYETKNKLKVYNSSMQRYIGEILLNIGDPHISEAEDWIKKAIETNQKYGMMWHLAQDYALYAEWFKRKIDPSKAKESLNKAIDIFKECGADGWVEKYEKELAKLS